MQVTEHIDALRREGALLAAAAEQSEPDVSIPTCPGWTMRDLLLHTGGVHRWAAAHVAEARTDPIDVAQPYDIVDALPSDDALVKWFVDGHASLVATLEAAPPDVEAFTFLPAPSPLAFWARRQAHETAIHRADAESPTGTMTPYPTEFAVDGIDELLLGFAGRRRRDEPLETSRTLSLTATDSDVQWWLSVTPQNVTVAGAGDGDNDAQCRVRASASDIYLLLWNRLDVHDVEAAGDTTVVDLWRTTMRVRWT
jgi:uncharacterized protein (TIGR03083 family)